MGYMAKGHDYTVAQHPCTDKHAAVKGIQSTGLTLTCCRQTC